MTKIRDRIEKLIPRRYGAVRSGGTGLYGVVGAGTGIFCSGTA